MVFPSVKCHIQTKRGKSITLLRRKLSVLSKHKNNEQYLKIEFILLRRQMGEMFCHFLMNFSQKKKKKKNHCFANNSLLFLAFVRWLNIQKGFVENVRTQRVLSKEITHHLIVHCISSKTAIIIKMNTPSAFFSAFQICSYTFSCYMNVPFKIKLV